MTTQQHLPIKDIKDDLVILKDGSMAMVIQTTAVNFDLLSENEQLAIIETFAQFLNSLSFVIQIVIRSKRLDISSYLGQLTEAQQRQKNPLLKQIMQHYQTFVATTIRENEVLDKQFFIVIPVSYYEVGLINNTDANFTKIKTLLIPRRDHVLKQLTRIGLKGTVLTQEKLIKLYYDIFNESSINERNESLEDKPTVSALGQQKTTLPQTNPVQIQPQPPLQPIIPSPDIQAPALTTYVAPVNRVAPLPQTNITPNTRINNHTPFVVEELGDEFGYV